MPIVMWCLYDCVAIVDRYSSNGGFVAKWDLAVGALSPEFGGGLVMWGLLFLLVSALLTAGYLLPDSAGYVLPW